ncbi:MAG: cation:dicarboxylase symporter family transporter [Azospirillaceae bacterium]|nr:cation:dicarboxylase symporter family transporter [Azospirillaceae bacterium]
MKTWLSKLYIQVFIGLVLGGLVGYFLPDVGVTLQPLADGFIKLIKMLLAPIIFGTIVVGVAKMDNLREVAGASAPAP